MTISSDLNTQSATHAYFEAASSEFAGDARTNLAVALIEYANESRHDTQQLRLAEEQQRRALEAHQVAAMHQEADLIRAAGRAEGLGAIVGGTLTATSGFVRIGSAASSNDPTKPSAKPTDASSSEPNIDWERALAGGGDMARGTGQLVGSRYDSLAQEARADQTSWAHRIDASDRRRQALDEQAQDALDLRQSGLEHLRNVSDSEAQAQQAMIFRG